MGQSLSCPPGFEKGSLFTCHATCPPRFKYVQESGGGTGPPISKCVHKRYNQLSFTLTLLPQLEEGEEPPSTFATEKGRVEDEIIRVDSELDDLVALKEVSSQKTKHVNEYSRIQSSYVDFKDTTDVINTLKEVKSSLNTMRPPTAPSSDLEKERKAILLIGTQDLFFIQFSLFLLILVFLSYLTLPTDTAHVLSFLLLSVGISIGFFLTR
jgi:hypothetical protein